MTSIQLSVTIITYNEEKNIERCINSVKEVADEVLVVDSFSTDKTKEICKRLGVNFIERSFTGYSDQKNYATEQAKFNHILSLDADEALSSELHSSIQNAKRNWEYDAYRFNRLTNYCGSWIRHSGWYPDTKLRLWDRRKGKWEGTHLHESIQLEDEASTKKLRGDLLHYSYYSVEQHMQQMNTFTTKASQEYLAKGKKVIPIWHLGLYPPLAFLNRYILKLGFLDGASGLMVCKSTAYYKFLKYAKLRQLLQNNQ